MKATAKRRFESVGFWLQWTLLVSLFAFLGFNRLAAARDTGSFGILWYGIRRDNWPSLFNVLEVCLKAWTGLVCCMVALGCVGLIVQLRKALGGKA